MPVRKTFNVTICGECLVWFPTHPDAVKGECRLMPPVPYSQYESQYPQVRESNPACFAGLRQPAPKKPAGKKKSS
jgi:hypothetical protein